MAKPRRSYATGYFDGLLNGWIDAATWLRTKREDKAADLIDGVVERHRKKAARAKFKVLPGGKPYNK